MGEKTTIGWTAKTHPAGSNLSRAGNGIGRGRFALLSGTNQTCTALERACIWDHF
jgi:hypothetical protein